MTKTMEQLVKLQKEEPNSNLFSKKIKHAKTRKESALERPNMKGREFALTCAAISGSVNSLIRKYIELGPSGKVFDAIVSGFLSEFVSINTQQINDPKFIWALEDEDLVNHWLMAIFFQHCEAEILYRTKVKEFLENPPEDSQWEDQDQYDPIYFSYLKNMLASVEAGKLARVSSGSRYDPFFMEQSVPSNAIEVLTDIHVSRASKGAGLKDPLEYNPWTVFPLEVMAWYRVATESGLKINLGDCYSSKFIEIPFKLEISHPDYLYLLNDVSELISFDVVEKYL